MRTHEELVRDWRDNARNNHERDQRFLQTLPVVSWSVDAAARELHREAFAALDCTRCAHCCKSLEVELTSADIDRLATHLNLPREEFIARYLLPASGPIERDDEGLPREHRFNAIPCPLLGADDRCSVYSARPRVCRVFPLTDQPGLLRKPWVLGEHGVECPGVYFVVKGLKKRLRRGR